MFSRSNPGVKIAVSNSDDIRIKELNPAVERGELDEVKKIIENNKNLSPNSLTIAKAIISDNVELIRYFAEKFAITPAVINEKDMNYAISNLKSHQMFEFLLKNYRCIRFGFNTETTRIVAKSGKLDNLKLLLSVRIPFADTGTLFQAVNSHNLECVKFLVEDYKIDGKLVITDYEESLEHAKRKGLNDIADYLQSKMPAKLILPENNKDDYQFKPCNPTIQPLMPNPKESELFDACKNLRSGDVKLLLNDPISPDIQDAEGNTPLFYAAVNCDFDSVDYLCDAGADINLKNKQGETPLIYVYQKRHSEIPLQLLLSKGANPYIKTTWGQKTLFTLAKESHRIVELGILHEWERDNRDVAGEFKLQADKPTTSQPRQSIKSIKLSSASHVNTTQTLSVQNEEKTQNVPHQEKENISQIFQLPHDIDIYTTAMPNAGIPYNDITMVMNKLSSTCKSFHSFFQETLDKRVLYSLWQAVIDDNREQVKKILDPRPALLLIEPSKNTVIENPRTQQKFYAENALTMAVKFNLIEMIDLLVAYYDELGKEHVVGEIKSTALSQWKNYCTFKTSKGATKIQTDPYHYEHFLSLIDIFRNENFPNGLNQKLSTKTESALLLLSKTLLLSAFETFNHFDVDLFFLAACEVYYYKLETSISFNTNQLDAFNSRVILLIKSFLLPENAKIFDQGIVTDMAYTMEQEENAKKCFFKKAHKEFFHITPEISEKLFKLSRSMNALENVLINRNNRFSEKYVEVGLTMMSAFCTK